MNKSIVAGVLLSTSMLISATGSSEAALKAINTNTDIGTLNITLNYIAKNIDVFSTKTTFSSVLSSIQSYVNTNGVSSFFSELDKFVGKSVGGQTLSSVFTLRGTDFIYSFANQTATSGTPAAVVVSDNGRSVATITAVPGPVAGTGLPAVIGIAGVAGYLGWRRRKNIITA